MEIINAIAIFPDAPSNLDQSEPTELLGFFEASLEADRDLVRVLHDATLGFETILEDKREQSLDAMTSQLELILERLDRRLEQIAHINQLVNQDYGKTSS